MDFAETIRGIFGGQSSQPPPSGDDYAAPLRPMVDPAARTRAVGGSPEFHGKVDETLRDALRETAEPFKQVGRAISGRSDNPVPEALLGGMGVATAIPGGLARGALKAGAKLGGEALEDIIAPAAKKAATGGVADMIKAYHGSPHDFDRFDLSKIGTGEGAQAYGHGLYFAENEGVAKGYRDALGDADNSTLDGRPVGEIASASYKKPSHEVTKEEKIADLVSSYGTLNAARMTIKNRYPELVHTFNELESSGRLSPGGKMYQVGIRANPEHFLDWDKPLSEQHPKVQEAIEDNFMLPTKPTDTGQQIHDNFVSYGRSTASHEDAQANVTKRLREAGIPGIKYLDQGSRTPKTLLEGRPIPQDHTAAQLAAEKLDIHGSPDAAMASLRRDATQGHPYIREDSQKAHDLLQSGAVKRHQPEGTRNYVVFDDKLIDILKKYGIAGIGALPAMNAFHYQDKQ